MNNGNQNGANNGQNSANPRHSDNQPNVGGIRRDPKMHSKITPHPQYIGTDTNRPIQGQNAQVHRGQTYRATAQSQPPRVQNTPQTYSQRMQNSPQTQSNRMQNVPRTQSNCIQNTTQTYSQHMQDNPQVQYNRMRSTVPQAVSHLQQNSATTSTPPVHRNNPHRKPTDLRLYIGAGAVILALLTVLLVILFSCGDGNSAVTDETETTEDAVTTADEKAVSAGPGADTSALDTANVTESPETTESPEKWEPVLTKTEDAGEEYLNKIVFLGDSTTYGLRHYAMLADGKETTRVWTPSSGTLALFNISTATVYYPELDCEITIKEALTLKQPEYLVITLGVNGIASMNERTFKVAYKWLLDTVKEVSPNTKIICQTMFPVASNYQSLGSINNEKIQRGNEWILDVAAENEVKFLDTYSVLVGEDGWLPQELQNGDGLHLNSRGFEIELENIRTHAYQD